MLKKIVLLVCFSLFNTSYAYSSNDNTNAKKCFSADECAKFLLAEVKEKSKTTITLTPKSLSKIASVIAKYSIFIKSVNPRFANKEIEKDIALSVKVNGVAQGLLWPILNDLDKSYIINRVDYANFLNPLINELNPKIGYLFHQELGAPTEFNDDNISDNDDENRPEIDSLSVPANKIRRGPLSNFDLVSSKTRDIEGCAIGCGVASGLAIYGAAGGPLVFAATLATAAHGCYGACQPVIESVIDKHTESTYRDKIQATLANKNLPPSNNTNSSDTSVPSTSSTPVTPPSNSPPPASSPTVAPDNTPETNGNNSSGGNDTNPDPDSSSPNEPETITDTGDDCNGAGGEGCQNQSGGKEINPDDNEHSTSPPADHKKVTNNIGAIDPINPDNVISTEIQINDFPIRIGLIDPVRPELLDDILNHHFGTPQAIINNRGALDPKRTDERLRALNQEKQKQ